MRISTASDVSSSGPSRVGPDFAPRAAFGYPRPVVHGSARRAPVAQRIEHLTTDQKVWGSNPYRRAGR